MARAAARAAARRALVAAVAGGLGLLAAGRLGWAQGAGTGLGPPADLAATDALRPGALLGATTGPGMAEMSVGAAVEEGRGTGATAGRQVLFLEVLVNGRPTGLIAEFALDVATGALLSPRSELIEVGIDPGARRGLVALDAIPGVTYAYDAAAQAVAIAADGPAILPRAVSAHRVPAPAAPDRSWGAVLNYGASVGLDEGALDPGSWEGPVPFDRLTLGTEAWAYSPFGVLSSTAVFGFDADGGRDRLRYETRFEAPLPRAALTFALGDVVSSSMAWGRSVRMAGIQLRREFGLRPDLVTEPLLSFGGAAAVPSAVDVFIDNARIWTGQVEAGPFRIEDLPILGGSGDAVVVIRDESGQVVTREVPFFGSRSLLKAGLADFSLEAGLAREGYGVESARYGEAPLGAASLRYGLGDRLTLEAHAEGTAGHALVSLGLATVLAHRVELGLTGGGSRTDGAEAAFGYGTLRTGVFGLDLEASALRAQDGFADLAHVTALADLGAEGVEGSLLAFPAALDVLSLSWSPGEGAGSLGVSYVRSDRGEERDEILGVSWARGLDWADASLNLSTTWDVADGSGRAAVLVSVPFGRGTTQASLARDGERGAVAGLALRAPLGAGVGDWGWDAGVERDDRGEAIAAAARWRSGWGTGEVAGRVGGDVDEATLRWDGALVVAGRRLAAGDTVADGFAVVDVGLPGVPVSLQNREVAVTGRGGAALVPGLVSYAPNRLSVDVDDLPLDATVAVTAAEVVPARRSGVVVDLGGAGAGSGPASGASALVVLRDAAGQLVPAGAEARLAGGGATVVGYDGQAFVTGLVPGAPARLSVRTPGGACEAVIELPPGAGLQPLVEATCR